MSIKSDVLEHLLNHPNEVVSLTALASTLDVTLDQVRNAVSNLRTGAVKQGSVTDDSVGMKEQIRVVSRGYAVKYVPKAEPEPTSVTPTPADVPKKHVVTTVVDSGSDGRPASVEAVMTDEPTIPIGVDHPYSDDVEVVLAQLGPSAYKVFSFIANQNGQNVTTEDVEYTAHELEQEDAKTERAAAKGWTPGVRRALYVVCIFFVFQQITGINVPLYYGPTLMASYFQSGSSVVDVATATIAVTTIMNFIVVGLALFVLRPMRRQAMERK